MNRRQFLSGAAATGLISLVSACQKKEGVKELPSGIQLVDKRDAARWHSLIEEFKLTHGKIWDVIGWNDVRPKREDRYSGNLYILSDIDEGAKQTVDLYDCFGIAMTGVSRETRARISGVSHQNVGNLRSFGYGKEFEEKFLIPSLKRAGLPLTPEEKSKPEWENPRVKYERVLKAWIREFMDNTEEEGRRIIMGDSQYGEGESDQRDYYLDSARYLADQIRETSGINPEILCPKLVRSDLIPGDTNYRLNTTDLMVFTEQNRVVFARPSYPQNRDEIVRGVAEL